MIGRLLGTGVSAGVLLASCSGFAAETGSPSKAPVENEARPAPAAAEPGGPSPCPRRKPSISTRGAFAAPPSTSSAGRAAVMKPRRRSTGGWPVTTPGSAPLQRSRTAARAVAPRRVTTKSDRKEPRHPVRQCRESSRRVERTGPPLGTRVAQPGGPVRYRHVRATRLVGGGGGTSGLWGPQDFEVVS